jgi:Family of unknown function (DUF5694)
MNNVVFSFMVFASALAAWAQAQEPRPDSRPEILILGTYHMANPGHDIYNMHADDVLAPKRQQEVAQLIAVLKKFKPTKIAIEADVSSKRRAQEYVDYVAGKHTLTQNEIEQIGFRLAKELGHTAIYPVDVDGDFPVLRVTNWAKANGKNEELEALSAGWGKRVQQQDAFLKSHTVLETLEFMNADPRVAEDVALYFGMVPYGEPWEYAGPDLLAAWYQRNIRIYHNIRALATDPNDRILVIYGAGHLGWLQQDVQNDASVKLRKLAEFTEKK